MIAGKNVNKFLIKGFKVLILLLLGIDAVFSQDINIIAGYEGRSTYHQIASEIQRELPELDILPSSGSVESLNKLMDDSSNINLAMVQYDALLKFQLLNSTIKDKVSIVLPMYEEEVHLITKSSSGINSANDLENRKVAIGSISQGTNISASLIISKLGIKKCEKIDITYRDAFAALLDDKIDAFFFVGGAPIANLESFPQEIAAFIKLVPIKSDKLLDIYKPSIIKSETYPWLKSDVETVSVRSYVVSYNSKTVDISRFLTAIKKNLKRFKADAAYHPKWKDISFNTKLPNWTINQAASNFFK